MNTLKAIIFSLGGGIVTLLVYLKIKNPDTVINQRIGKVKQKGEGNLLDVTMKQFVTHKESRKAKQASRKAERLKRKSERKAKKSVLSEASKKAEI